MARPREAGANLAENRAKTKQGPRGPCSSAVCSGKSDAAHRVLAQMADDGHLIHAGLLAASLDFRQALGLLFGGEFQRLQVLEGRGQVELGRGIFLLDVTQGGAQVFAAHFDRLQEGREG